MNPMHLSSIDLNLLRVFDVLLEERSVTRTGKRLGITQSAVSHALNRLRYHLDDELFQRNANGMQPTRRALEIGPSLHVALSQLQSALTPADFEPETSDHRFHLIAGAYAFAVLIPPLVGEMQARAPNMLLRLGETPPDLLEQVDSGRIDCVISSFERAPERFARERLLQEELVWVVRGDHPLARSGAGLEGLVSVPHVVVAGRPDSPTRPALSLRSTWEDCGAFEIELAKHGLSRKVAVVAPDTFSAMAIVARTEMASLIPRRLAQLSIQSGRLAVIEPPYESPRVDVSLLYRKDRLIEPPLAWIRRLIAEVAARI
jgi:DNA-binding transcriptional LysR family regulator